MEHEILVKAVILLAIAAIVAPLAKHLKIGVVLGYLLAGLAIGPYGLGVFTQVSSILHVAEFGIVLLLFVIGLELRVQRLWIMRNAVFGIGASQVALTALALTGLLMVAGKSGREAAFLGLALALSSTAFVIQSLQEKGELGKSHGRLSFSVLLFQDLAAMPMIAFAGLFSIGSGTGEPMTLEGVATAISAIVLVVFGGRYLIKPLYRWTAATRVKEAMTASALLTVGVVALLMEIAGLSPALGAFIAGALLADSEYRHELQANLAPFEGLLLGLFFVAVGMTLNLGIIVEQPVYVLAALIGLLSVKIIILWILGRWQGLDTPAARRFALILSQGGEFAFVLATAGHQVGAIFKPAADMIVVVVTLSMMVTPLLLLLDDWISGRASEEEKSYDQMPKKQGHVIIAGFGRFGQIVARILAARQIPFTALDNSAKQIDFVRDFGNKIYYGDPTRVDILKAAHADEASAFVLAMDDPEAALKTARIVKNNFPDLPILARARDRRHVHRLRHIGVDATERDTFHSALAMTHKLLRGLGFNETDTRHTITVFAEQDARRLDNDFAHYDDRKKVRESARRQAEELRELFTADAEQLKENHSEE